MFSRKNKVLFFFSGSIGWVRLYTFMAVREVHNYYIDWTETCKHFPLKTLIFLFIWICNSTYTREN